MSSRAGKLGKRIAKKLNQRRSRSQSTGTSGMPSSPSTPPAQPAPTPQPEPEQPEAKKEPGNPGETAKQNPATSVAPAIPPAAVAQPQRALGPNPVRKALPAGRTAAPASNRRPVVKAAPQVVGTAPKAAAAPKAATGPKTRVAKAAPAALPAGGKGGSVLAAPRPREVGGVRAAAGGKQPRKKNTARLRYVPALDGLRGLAVAAVIIYHFFGDVLPGGYLGVDMFFVLSGFLITSLLVREFDVTGGISLRDFWVRRFRRILPAAVAVLAICTALVGAIGGDIAVNLREQFFGTLFFANNWVQIATSQSYFADNEVQVFAHYWSLAVEEQFYLLWPLIILGLFSLGRRQPRRLALGVSVTLGVASALAMAWLVTPGEDPTRVYYGTDTHAFGLLAGAGLSLIITTRNPNPEAPAWPHYSASGRRVAEAVGLVALVAYAAQLLFMADDLTFTYRGGLLASSVLGVAIICGILAERPVLNALFANRFMRWAGKRSFSLYLWHWPVVIILRELIGGANVWAVGIVALLLSAGLAEVSYRCIENPLRRRGYRTTAHDFWSARPGWATLRSAWKVAAWPLVPVLIFSSLGGIAWGLTHSGDKTSFEQELDDLAAQNQSHNAQAPSDDSPRKGGGDAASAPNGKTSEDKKTPDMVHPMPSGDEITAVGDSVMLASSQSLQDRFPGIYIDAAVSRHYDQGVPAIQQLADSGQLRDTVFLGFGTNGPQLDDEIDQMMKAIGPKRTVLIATPYGDRDWMTAARQETIAAVEKYDNVYLADWCSHAQHDPNYLREDGIHPVAGVGTDQYALAFYYGLLRYAHGEKATTTKCEV